MDLVQEDGDAFEDAICETVRALASQAYRLTPASTTLVVMAICGEICHVANFGDSAAFRAKAPEGLVQPNDLMLGPALASPALRRMPFATHFRREPGERVGVVSDGVTSYLRDTSQVPLWLAEEGNDLEAARRVAEGALNSGAGDNVAVVAYGGPEPQSD
jgi:serine/threonine protein phosphatase PrpC